MSSLSSYLREVRGVPLLTPEEESCLAKKCRAGDAQAREQLISGNLRLVISIAKKYNGRGVELKELISAGNEGLLKSIKRYRPAKGYRFSTFAFWAIRCEILKTFASGPLVRLPEARAAALRSLNAAAEKLLQKGVVPTMKLLSRISHLSQTQIRDIYSYKVAGYVSLSSPTSDPASPDMDIASTDSSASFEKLLADQLRQRTVGNLLKQLPEREATILREYYGIGTERKHLEGIANSMHLTTERVRQLKERALKRLRENNCSADIDIA